MKTIRGMCTLALVTACLQGSLATAQTVADPNATKVVEQVQTRQLESLLGREVRTRGEGDSGRIIDLLTDRDGKLQAAVVEMGGFLGIGTRKIADALLRSDGLYSRLMEAERRRLAQVRAA